MNTPKSTFFSMFLTLVTVTGVAALSLSFVYDVTKEPIELARLAKQRKAIDQVVGDYTNDPISDAVVYCRNEDPSGRKNQFRNRQSCPEHLKDEEQVTFYPARVESRLNATAVKSYSENGYSGTIELMVGISAEGKVTNIEVIRHAETPGLGSKMSEEDFKNQFFGRVLTEIPLKVKKDGGDIDALSGATISSRAYSEAVQQALEAYQQYDE